MAKYIFITGGVVSSLGKGIASASLAALLQERGYKVRMRKFDPYLNVDPGTMSPHQHGEVFITDDGAETDLDLGHYERFTGINTKKSDSISAGRVYWNVLEKERQGDFLGATIQVIPHITDAIQEVISADITNEDFVLCEIGGTVGDIESTPFLEAIRQFSNKYGHENCLFLHVTLLPYIQAADEVKTKPTQHSVKELLSNGIQPNIILCRTQKTITDEERAKIALFCNVSKDNVIPAYDSNNIYSVPVLYHEAGLDIQILKYFKLSNTAPLQLARWKNISDIVANPKNGVVKVAIAGKYRLRDSYKSLLEALNHGGIANNVKVDITMLPEEFMENGEKAEEVLKNFDAILIPGGYGVRGSEAKISAIKYARENKVPLLGICLGMQMSVIEFARNVVGIKDAGSSEFGKCTPVVGLINEWQHFDGSIRVASEDGDKGGTQRLGAYTAKIEKGSLIEKIYNSLEVSERHRHRYEINISYREEYLKHGLWISSTSPDGKLPEMMELKDHPWFVGVQFHPELKSRPFSPHPLFVAFIKAALDNRVK